MPGLSQEEELERHTQRHIILHKRLDELVADFIKHTGGLPSKTTLLEFMEWSHKETLSPTEKAA